VRLFLFFVAAGPLLAPSVRASAAAPPRPLTEAERYGAQLAADYLAGGRESVWEKLGSGSPLRDLGREAALDEIEVRFGSPEGARWELRTPPRGFSVDRVLFSIEHPSGLDQAVLLGITREDGKPRLRSIRSFSEPPLRLDPGPTMGGERAGTGSETRGILAVGACSLLAAFALGAAIPLRRRRVLAGALAALGVGASVAAFAAFSRLEPSEGGAGTASLERVQRLGHVLADRRRLESGKPPENEPGSGPGAVAVRLWEAQIAQQRGETERAVRLLALVPKADEVPWADVLRGRLAFMSGNEAESVGAYQRVIDEGLFHDGLLAEALDAFSILGYATGREWSLEKLVGLGSRAADVHYLVARELQTLPRLGDPVEAFRVGWSQRPMDRATLFGAGRLWYHLRRPEVLAQLGIGEAEAATSPYEGGAAEHPALSTSADTRLCGSTLRVRYPGGGELLVPGGLAIAPDGTRIEDPDVERREAGREALADLETLRNRLSNPGAVSQPALRVKLERTAIELANRHRWAEVASLTAGYSGAIEQVPPVVALLRAEALRRTGRIELAKGLLAEIARNPVLDRVGGPGLLLALSDLFRATGDLAGAIRAAERAFRQRPVPYVRQLIGSLKAEQRLEEGFETQIAGRFDLRYRSGEDRTGPILVGQILNDEWKRMAPWFPSLDGRPVVVDILPYVDFAETYGTEILGLYDGKIRVPVFGVARFSPPIVSILSHELAHAMIADATGDKAPGWLHEGLAQRLEMRPERVNRVGDLVRWGTYLSLPALEEVLRSHPDPDLVAAAYAQAEWLVHFLERRFGRKAIGVLLESYRTGRSTEEAVLAATSLSMGELDRRFRAWALRDAPKRFEDSVVVRYDRRW